MEGLEFLLWNSPQHVQKKKKEPVMKSKYVLETTTKTKTSEWFHTSQQQHCKQKDIWTVFSIFWEKTVSNFEFNIQPNHHANVQ